ncbi:uncharacterized protein, partial [Miscanthus floridulus]|uniref:uncharacterized protein n=1 Tax=Miscanthus floridulus TaxID=154761 RepID=UPI0034587674
MVALSSKAAKKAAAIDPPPDVNIVEEQNQEEDRVQVEEIADHLPSPPLASPPPPTSKPSAYDINRLPYDLGERLPIEDYPVNDQDAIRRAYITKGACKPYIHDFPYRNIGGVPRRFSIQWLHNYEWLEYSVKKDSAFCFICYLFKKGSGSKTFIVDGWNNWNIGITALLKHSGSRTHKAAQEKYIGFMNPKVAIDYNIDKWSEEELCLYKKRLTYSLRCIKFLLHQGLAFRGHDESEESSNRGNFIELLKFLTGNSEEVNKYVLNNAPDDTTSLSLKKAIEVLLVSNGLSMQQIRDQVLVAVAKGNTDCKTFFDQVSILLNIVGVSCKRHDMLRNARLENVKKALECGELESGSGLNQEMDLPRPGDTRWGSHYKTICSIITIYSSIHDVLIELGADNAYKEDWTKMHFVLRAFETFEFVFFVHLMYVILGYTNELSECLQRRDQDILNAISLVNVAKSRMQELRSNGWDNFLQKVTSFCIKHGVEVPAMDGAYVPYGKSARGNCECCMSAFSPSNSFASFDARKVRRLAEFYPKDFSNNDLLKLELQLDNYIDDMRQDASFQGLDNIVDLSVKLIETKRHKVYDMVYLLLKLILLLPVATASVERVFSALVIVKTKSRNKIGDIVLDDCLVTFIERDIFFQVNEDDIIETFMSLRKRRINKESGREAPRPRQDGARAAGQDLATVIDEKVLDDCLNEISRTLLQADVQFKMVRDMQANIKRIINLEALAAGTNKRRIMQQAVFTELCNMLDPRKPSFTPKTGKPSVVMFVGLQ